jgi:hypothetical protein
MKKGQDIRVQVLNYMILNGCPSVSKYEFFPKQIPHTQIARQNMKRKRPGNSCFTYMSGTFFPLPSPLPFWT